ncbi:flagellar biosynthesis protein FlhB [Pseudomonas sp. HMWF032]|uniref:EscU/YscU/HrcU family type III secretion system export apparatus switch protein n=1 Tax=unclassified Pseudomonas TaxID=196821 RepID=UPI000D370F7B|nr:MULTISPECIES: EscU/YscU/HrcU family type III secretion system export apparatus switch protein [unclassified Pseudomonas]PTS82763.1 flagellar biosynthesis protein FlhB [Pseudomonas sp. HMWF032]PTT72854.1 flagellar biosynthesis protein FlhB [Pseudomonas sp. HMWF010]WAC43638.1 EscU/YscU/HrcU family type III secretion system export apparatus switch protein [Pseudomonas sp. SL4(2022)]
MKKTTPRQAIALTYDGQNAPVLSAKGDDELAEAILAIAREYEVPIYENAELVRLLARLELGEAIPEQLYRCIAEIIAFAWYLKGKAPTSNEHDTDITPPLRLLEGPAH